MADRELRVNERIGTFIQHRYTGSTGTIAYKTDTGYLIDWITNGENRFLPYSKVNDYVVIQ